MHVRSAYWCNIFITAMHPPVTEREREKKKKKKKTKKKKKAQTVCK